MGLGAGELRGTEGAGVKSKGQAKVVEPEGEEASDGSWFFCG